ncbi:MAG: peptidase M19 [Magnetovibrio sp.]|nr:peptidase M19 [Magnetovibrio sp.]|tara:strand:- start:1 stop:1032 length:1032 start_codon:yes stop_codon:yes gene_type:complete
MRNAQSIPLISQARDLHHKGIIIDGVCPLLMDKKNVSWYLDGGLTVAVPTVAIREPAEHVMRTIGSWHRFISNDDRLCLICESKDIRRAKENGQMGIVFHFQGTDSIEDDLNLLDVFKKLGVGMVQLTYNVKNRVGDGACERTNDGLSIFGVELVKRYNELGIVVDGSHSGERTTLDAINQSTKPFVFSHANAKALYDSPRNITDEQMRACASTGGLVGIVGFPGFLGPNCRPTLDHFIDFIDYAVELIGPDHVGLGLDYYMGMDPIIPIEQARARYDDAVSKGRWNPDIYPPPPHHFPTSIETPRALVNLTAGLLDRGYNPDIVLKIMGGNWLRVFENVWDN